MVGTGWYESDAEACMKNDKNSFCTRLQCAKDHWQLTDGKGSTNTGDFWEGHVKKKLEEFITKGVVDNGRSTTSHCDNEKLNNANKQACGHITTLLQEMYKNQNQSGDPKQYSNQIIKCLLLKEYANKLKKQAKQKGYCSIDEGINHAFTQSKTIIGNASTQCPVVNGPNSCFECSWNDKDDYEDCPIDNSQSANGKVKDKVDELFKKNDQTVDTKIQKTVTDMHNKSTPCERIQCAAHWWGEKNKNNGTVEWNKMWEEVVKGDVTSLGKSMSDNKNSSADDSLTKHCIKLDNKNREICFLFTRGLDHMYKNVTGNDDAMKLFKRTMMCAALNAYAKKIKADATAKKNNGTGSCDIDNGIEQAFKQIKTIMSGESSQCKDPKGADCFECTQDQDFDKCEINTNGQGTTGENVNSRLKTMFEDKEDKTGLKESLDKICENVNSKLQTMFEDEQDKTGLKESLDKICLECLDKKELCQRAQCVADRWVKQTNGVNGQARNWTEMWNEVQTQVTSLGTNISNNKDKVETHCTDLHSEEEKTVCKFIASGLKGIYEIKAGQGGNAVKITKKDLEDQLFKRTMQCVLLNAFADKLEALPCSKEKKIEEAVTKAFNDENDTIKNASDRCTKDGDKCFKCIRFNGLTNCEIGENGNKEKVKGKVEPMLEGDNTLKKESLEKKICKPCTQDNFCAGLQCVAKKWGERNNKSSNGKVTWENMKGDFEKELKAVLHAMTTNQTAFADHCKNNNWKDGDAAGEANKTACKLVAAGLEHISKIQHEYSTKTGQPDKNENPYDNQEFKQLVSCLMLKAVAQKMKEDSKICDIDQGIRAAFGKADAIKGKHCQNGKPCTVCNWAEKYDDCYLDTAKEDQVKPKLEALLDEKKTEVEGALMDITKTAGNNSSTLCLRLQCLAPRVQASSSANTFWTKEGEVGQLWNVLSTAMKANKNNEAQCNTMDNDNREATNPEKKACNYLHAALKKLYETTTPATPSASSSGTISLNDNPPLKQTVGCLLLHAYAKKMKGATCLVDSGIKKAFDTAVKNLIGNCNGGTESCVPCLWNEGNYDNCEITKNGTTEDQTPVKDKLEQVQNKITETSNTTLKDINEMSTLCDFIKCAGPKWFKNKAKPNGNSVTATKNWCEFWNEGVKHELTNLFTAIQRDGKDKSNIITTAATCKNFGDGNEHSVERKACNHIIAGLDYINKIPNGSVGGGGAPSNGKDKQLLDRAVACIALNMYADKIIALSEKNCPIHEERIKKMFEDWNKINNNSCKSGDNNCFVCERKADFNDCELSVSSSLISSTSTPSNGDCSTTAPEAVKVQPQMNKLLNEKKSIPQVNKTLSTINEMNTFCSKMQCAAKQYYAKVKSKPPGKSTNVSWSEINGAVNDELKELLQNITDDEKWKNFDQYCKDDIKSNGDTPGEITAKQKACKLFASGLKHISEINNKNNQDDAVPLKQTMMCAALNLYADQLIEKAENQCPLDNKKLEEAIKHAFGKSSDIMGKGTSSCSTANGSNSCFICNREKNFADCQIGTGIASAKVKEKMEVLLKDNDGKNTTPNMTKTLDKINEIETFCTQVQCAIKQELRRQNKLKNGTEPSWSKIEGDAKDVLTKLIEQMTKGQTEPDLLTYCNDENKWSKFGHKGKHTNKAACLLFAAGLQHIYTHDNGRINGRVNGRVNGPSFGQTMGCLFLKEYAKQLQKVANEKKRGNSWVHPLCSIKEGITHASSRSEDIMNAPSKCNNNVPNSCFVCKLDDYDKLKDCSIGNDKVKPKVEAVFTEDSTKQNQMQQTLENTVCPILLTDLLTPFLPLAPVSIGLSAMAYYLWKYFGPLGKGGPRFRRSPAEIPGPSVQEQVLDHVQQDSSHEYQLVKERKPRSAPTRTKRSGGVNRRTIIEIHFEVLDECQKGDTQLNQKDFLELLVQEFMGSELMVEEQVPKEEVLMEGVPMEEVPSLGSGLLV
ncbi:SICAvar, type I [Plasmodium knowlesi strain H]|uniref:SICAvar, type I n=1 Tax=Plasmodium knowlesi (strain H) TaxID=5851 RepID=A0A1A7W6K1_PLAKH|nr:SICAvar, type I [Plasmodium knowlesi strain H]